MRVLLVRHHDTGNINTRLPESLNKAQGIFPPLGIAYIAAVLEREHEVRVLDSQALNMTTDETKRAIAKFNPDIVGSTCLTSTIRGALEVARLAKEINPEIITVLGGPQLRAYPVETVSNSNVDYGVMGEGEITLPMLCSGMEASKIPGLVWKKDNKVIINPGFPTAEKLDNLPFPARHLLPVNRYWCVITGKPFVTQITARGCPYNCAFCFKSPIERKIRFHSPKYVVDEMEECLERYRVKEIMFYDDTFTLNQKRTIEICEEILRRGLDIPWEAPTRVDRVNPALLHLMKRAGCIRLRYGVESGDARVLKLMNKQITIEQVRRAFKWTKEVGIETFAYFMVAYLTETETEFYRTLKFAKEIDPDWVVFAVTTPYPCSSLYEYAAQIKLWGDGDYWADFTLGKRSDRMPYFHLGAERWCKKAYKDFYLRPSFVLKKFAKLRSFDQLRKYAEGAWGIVWFSVYSHSSN